MEVFMTDSDFLNERNKLHKNFQKEMPDIARSFNGLMDITFKEGALSSKTKELIALGISVCVRCEPCMHYHIEHAMKKGATKEEVLEAMQVGYEMAVGYVVPPLRKVLYEHFGE
jgi:AhpD family alkylhydroperoxidase